MRADLIGRHLSPGRRIEEELAILSTQSAPKQEEIERRLTAIDTFTASEEKSLADADAAAAQLGLSRRSFYRLLAKVRQYGPVRALAPGYRNVERKSRTRHGFDEPIEAMLVSRLREEPDARVSDIAKFIEIGCSERGLRYPGEPAIRRRVRALRSSGRIIDSVTVGARIAVDQSAVTLSLDSGRPAVVTLIIDQGSKLILSMAVSEPNDGGVGLEQALWRLRERLPKLPLERVERLDEITWIVPPHAEWLCELERCGLAELERGRTIVAGKDPRRHGDAIVRLLGDRLGPYEFRRYATAVDVPVKRDHVGVDGQTAWRLIAACVDSWNSRVLAGQSTSSAAPNATQQKKLDRLAKNIDHLFAPVLKAIEDRQAAVRQSSGF